MNIPVQTQAVLLTHAAADVVRELFNKRNLDNSYALRVFVAERTCSGLHYGMTLDNNLVKTDYTFESEGIKVLIDEQSIQYIAGAKIDYIDDEHGKGFLIENPNSLPTCSCESGTCGTNDN